MIFWKYSCILPKKKALDYGYEMWKSYSLIRWMKTISQAMKTSVKKGRNSFNSSYIIKILDSTLTETEKKFKRY